MKRNNKGAELSLLLVLKAVAPHFCANSEAAVLILLLGLLRVASRTRRQTEGRSRKDTLAAMPSIFLAMASDWATSCCLCSDMALLTSFLMPLHRVSVFWLVASSSDASPLTLLCHTHIL
jgi:hypothetical protein